MILLASGFSVDVTTVKCDGASYRVSSKKVFVNDIIIPVIIGVNPPEREEKQRVVVNIVLYEETSKSGPTTASASPNYPKIISRIAKDIEASSYLTLERFVMQVVCSACLSSEKIHTVSARAQKPSALSFAQSSGVEITRKRESLL
ncbi:Dihydroneopterin aldolase-domain-containing protein [Gymnopilus junonius]|uniref:dihydroneopterin aldolase n=1 Tax=Gymnopilus junonius TaxID=109634 RepID=A0A9P5TMD3_GYMJU|nr:Dihydroneopterin aldolase-domain-containing protein [Gymnopilus junonius]